MKKFTLDKTSWIAFGAFTVLSLILVLNHEPWRDEAQAWLIARDSSDLLSLISLMGYEGTPALWHLILFPLAKLGFPYLSLAIVNLLIMLGAVFILLCRAPFSKWQKNLFIFGYFIFYEYNVLARNYGLLFLLLVLVASFYQKRFQKPIIYPLLLITLANTSVFGLVIALILCAFYLGELTYEKMFQRNHLISLSMLVSGLFIAIYQLLPPADLSPHLGRWDWNLSLVSLAKSALGIFAGALVPIPQLKVDFWNTLLISGSLKYLLGGLLYGISLGLLVKKPRAFAIYLLITVGLTGLFVFKYPGALRHHGLIFVALIFSLWISQSYSEKAVLNIRLLGRLASYFTKKRFLTVLMLFQVVAASFAAYYELKYDFSAAGNVGRFLMENGYQSTHLISSYRSYAASSILPFISNSKFYYLEYQDYGSYMVWNKRWYSANLLSTDEILERLTSAKATAGEKEVIFISNFKVSDDKYFTDRYNLITCFEGTIQKDESFCLYQEKR
jgi:hypothetical protein